MSIFFTTSNVFYMLQLHLSRKLKAKTPQLLQMQAIIKNWAKNLGDLKILIFYFIFLWDISL